MLASNPLPGRFVSFVGADDYDIGYRQARYLFDNLGGKGLHSGWLDDHSPAQYAVRG